jgi:hypothetical protein
MVGADIQRIKAQAFEAACLRGHLEVAQWLYNFGAIDILDRNEYLFRVACCGDENISLAQWL